ncbi:uncharacterized protein [Littorina saxatilis]|uniref:uncharacterized protein isoform X2 n=1 Tax=Littorina saxatilis TaxID=31220 RepID=UPI0038B69EEC
MNVYVLLGLCAAVFGALYGTEISPCGSNKKVDADETRQFVLRCTEDASTAWTLYWSVTLLNRPGIQIAECSNWSQSPCPVNSSDYTVTRTQRDHSTLTVKRNHRSRIAGKVKCTVDWYQPSLGELDQVLMQLEDTCDVRVVHQASNVSNCRTEVDTSDWTVFGSCDVDKMYASDQNYGCQWIFTPGNAAKTNGLKSLSNFKENNKDYKRATCSFSGLPMPTTDGIHGYSFTINPGKGTVRGQSLEIRHPGDPTLDHCPQVITEGDDVKCACQPSASSPPALVTWSAGTDFNALLQLQNVSMALNGTSFTCTQYWGGYSRDFQKIMTYTLNVEVYLDLDNSTMTISGASAVIAEIIGGVVVIVVVVLIVVSICIWINRLYARPRRRGQEEDSHVYSDVGSGQGDNEERPARGAQGIQNRTFEPETEQPAARHVTENRAPQDDQVHQYIELTESHTTVSDEDSYDLPDMPSQPPPTPPGRKCENTTCKELLASDGGGTGMQCENTIRKQKLTSDEGGAEMPCENTIRKQVTSTALNRSETTSPKRKRRDADGYEIPVQNNTAP